MEDQELQTTVPKEVFGDLFPESSATTDDRFGHYRIKIFYMKNPILSSEQLESERMYVGA